MMNVNEIDELLLQFATDNGLCCGSRHDIVESSRKLKFWRGRNPNEYSIITLFYNRNYDPVTVSDIIKDISNYFSIDLKTGKTAVERPSKDEYYLGIAQAVAKRSTCIRRQYGAVIVKDDRIISTGYNGSARGCDNCCDKGVCWREQNHIPHGEQYEKCQAVHAEANAIINGNPSDMIGATLYLAGFEDGKLIEDPKPCMMCERLITNARIEKVINKF